MKRRIAITVATFIVVCAFSAFAFWCGGYNFDHRNGDVAFGVLFSTVFAGFLAKIAWEASQ